jgi:hypothetical protein
MKCHSEILLFSSSIDGRLCAGQETPEPSVSARPCASESLNFSESIFSLFLSELYIATWCSLLNNFEYHLASFISFQQVHP